MDINDIFDYLENLRRETYVTAVVRDSEANDVVGYIGSKIPVEIFYSMGLFPIPVYGIDAEILKFSHEKNLCSVIDSTLTYAETDKCPLIHSSKIIVLEDFCPIMTQKLRALEKIYVYDFDDSKLISKLENTYSRSFKQKSFIKIQLETINNLLEQLKYHSDLTGLQVFILEYYLKFLSLDEQINILNEVSQHVKFQEKLDFLPVKIQFGAGIYRQLDEIYNSKNYRLIENFCDVNSNYDFVFENCPYSKGKKISYK